jgi:hypothetical protein
MTKPLLYLSDRILEGLRKEVEANLIRYTETGFTDLADDPGWDVPLDVEVDHELLATLDPSTPSNVISVDLPNSVIVGTAISGLTTALANEERIWARLAHVEAIEYSRSRWLSGRDPGSLPSLVRDHFFAPTQTGIRDDHGISRLWWNFQIAKTCMPEDVTGALNLIMKSADIRSNFVERIWMTSRRSIASGVLRAMQTETWITSTENHFRGFMKALNRYGSGIVFEALSVSEVDEFVLECVNRAKQASEA